MTQTNFLKLTKTKAGAIPGEFAADFATNMEIIDNFASQQAIIFKQETPAEDWIIEHNLNRMPLVTIVDDSNTVIVGEVEYIDENNLAIHFSEEVSGKVYLR